MPSGFGVPKPNKADHPGRQAGRDKFFRVGSTRMTASSISPAHVGMMSPGERARYDFTQKYPEEETTPLPTFTPYESQQEKKD